MLTEPHTAQASCLQATVTSSAEKQVRARLGSPRDEASNEVIVLHGRKGLCRGPGCSRLQKQSLSGSYPLSLLPNTQALPGVISGGHFPVGSNCLSQTWS